MKTLIFTILAALGIAGCGVGQYSAKTSASYAIGADGAKTISYESNKEQVGLDAIYEVDEKGTVKAVHIKVDKAGTSEAAIAAALQQQQMVTAMFAKMIEALIPLLVKAAAIAGTGGAAAVVP